MSRLIRVALMAVVVIVAVTGRQEQHHEEEGNQDNLDTHAAARFRIRDITNLITNKFQHYMSRSGDNIEPEEETEKQADKMPNHHKDDVKVLPTASELDDALSPTSELEDEVPATSEQKNVNVLEDTPAPACDREESTSSDDLDDLDEVLSDAEESSTSDDDEEDENSIYTHNDYESFLSREYIMDDYIPSGGLHTRAKDALEGREDLRPPPITAEIYDDAEGDASAVGQDQLEIEVGDAGTNVIDEMAADTGHEEDGEAAKTVQDEGEEEEEDTDTDSNDDSDVPFHSLSSDDYEDLTESSDSDDNEANDGYQSDAFNWYDDYSDYDASDTDDSSDDMLHLNDLADLSSDSEDEYDTDSSDDEGVASDNAVKESGDEAASSNETPAVEIQDAAEATPTAEATPEATVTIPEAVAA